MAARGGRFVYGESAMAARGGRLQTAYQQPNKLLFVVDLVVVWVPRGMILEDVPTFFIYMSV
jgi:hypothetical protein